MIYETAIVLRAELTEEAVNKAKELVNSVVAKFNGEVLLTEDWGVKTFAQPTSNGIRNGKYIYFMFKTDSIETNPEILRLLKISEDVLKYIIVKLGKDADQEAIVKGYKNPNTQTADDEGRFETDKDKRLFAKKKSCYFSAKKIKPDWKDPQSYSWLVNEFGKISPARVTGLIPKFQRSATTAIKRGRAIGLISYINSNIAR
ncbi:MAG: small subunit ribosomal protein S6 [Thermoproteota archaeon]|jgi:small subunit ribosomal protein S6